MNGSRRSVTVGMTLVVGFATGLVSAFMLAASPRGVVEAAGRVVAVDGPGARGEPVPPMPPATAEQRALDADDFLERMNQATRRIAQAVEPSVVFVGIEEPLGGGRRMMRSLGSGWVYAKRDDVAFVVTNQHVVKEAARITVQFSDGKRAAATLVGEDAGTDVAVLKVEGAATAVVARRASGLEPQQGDRVYAFGSPFGLKFSMSEGIVSGLGRDPGTFGETYTNYIQSDASVNPGNSGGPLVDVRGRVVGMNVAIATEAGEADGPRGLRASERVSFAIPLETIESVATQLIESGAVTKGFLGINFPISDDLNTSRLDRAAHRGNGVVVTGVMDGTPAEVAGVRVGDIIVRLNEREVLGIAALRSMIATTRPGEQVRLRIVRDGKGRDVTVKLADRDEGQKQLAEMRGALDRFGLRRYSSVDAGVQLDVVREGSDADKAGLAPGQVVTAVDGAPVQGTDVLFSKLRAGGFLDGREVTLTVSPEADDDGERGAATEVKVRLATRK